MSARLLTLQVAVLAGAIVVAGLVALGLAAIIMHIPEPAGAAIGLFLAISGALTLLLTAPLLWLVARSSSLRLRSRLIIAVATGGAVALLNVLVTAWLMFISPHDLALLFLLLLFSLLVSLSFAGVLSEAVMGGLTQVASAARRLAEGDLTVRVPTIGQGELAELAHDFNGMAARLEAAFRQERELEAARRSLVANVSHDLRSPLASIRAGIEALHDGVVAEPDEVKRYLATALRDLTQLSRLIDDLFELARLDAGAITLHLEETPLGDLISDTLESVRVRADQRGIRVHGHVDGEPVARADAAKLQRVLDNLMENALQHTEAGGAVELVARQESDGVIVEVRDTGLGIAAADLPLIFDRFYRGDPARRRASGGAGLGLAIARGFVEAHGGTIAVQSKESRGATFTVTLPRRGPRLARGTAIDTEENDEEGRHAGASPTR